MTSPKAAKAGSPAMLTPKDIAADLQVSYLHALDLINDGVSFPNAINIGGEGTGRRLRVPRTDYEQFLASRRVAA